MTISLFDKASSMDAKGRSIISSSNLKSHKSSINYKVRTINEIRIRVGASDREHLTVVSKSQRPTGNP